MCSQGSPESSLFPRCRQGDQGRRGTQLPGGKAKLRDMEKPLKTPLEQDTQERLLVSPQAWPALGTKRQPPRPRAPPSRCPGRAQMSSSGAHGQKRGAGGDTGSCWVWQQGPLRVPGALGTGKLSWSMIPGGRA